MMGKRTGATEGQGEKGGHGAPFLGRLQRIAAAGMAEASVYTTNILDVRARRLAAARARSEEIPAGTAVLAFRVGGEIYALPLSGLAEVSPLGKWTPVPGASQHLLGVINVRGEIRPLINLHTLLSLPEPEGEKAYAVFMRRSEGTDQREVGLRVDGLDRIRFVRDDDLTLPHAAANGLPQRFISGISSDTLILLDPRQILALDVLQDHRAATRAAL